MRGAVEKTCFTPLVFTASGGMGQSAGRIGFCVFNARYNKVVFMLCHFSVSNVIQCLIASGKLGWIVALGSIQYFNIDDIA